MNKQLLRKEALASRLSLSKANYWQLNDDLLIEFSKFSWHNYQYVHLFLPILSKYEVDTFELISFFKEKFPEINLVVSRSDFTTNSIIPILFDPYSTVLAKNKYQIPEPLYGEVIDTELIDAVLIPLLCFDEKGNRIGYGAGFYDRFLSACKPNVHKIGLSFFPPIKEDIEISVFDIPLNYCITSSKTYIF